MRRILRALKYIFLILLALVGVGLIWFAVVNARATAQIEERIQKLRSAGEPVSLKDLARKPIPPENNAATYLDQAKKDVEAIQKAVHAAEQTEDEAVQLA